MFQFFQEIFVFHILADNNFFFLILVPTWFRKIFKMCIACQCWICECCFSAIVVWTGKYKFVQKCTFCIFCNECLFFDGIIILYSLNLQVWYDLNCVLKIATPFNLEVTKINLILLCKYHYEPERPQRQRSILQINPWSAQFFHENLGGQRFFTIWKHHNCLS